jgi:hypothetical protein
MRQSSNCSPSYLQNFSKDDVPSVEPRRFDGGDEELGSILSLKKKSKSLRRTFHSNVEKFEGKRPRERTVFGPAFAMERRKGPSCLRIKFSSANFEATKKRRDGTYNTICEEKRRRMTTAYLFAVNAFSSTTVSVGKVASLELKT